MRHFLNEDHYFKTRKAWLILTFSTLILELIALYFQHIMLLKPCVLCIYQRCALGGIMLSGLCASISPTFSPLRIGGLLFWTYSAWKGLLLAKKQNDIHLHSSPFVTCDFFVNFPSWLPLDKWIPSIFYAYGDCTEYKWYFLTLEMTQWMIIIFLIYLIIPIVLLSVFLKHLIQKNKN